MTILDGRALAQKIKDEIKLVISKDFIAKKILPPKLAILSVGDNPASSIYVSQKIKACEFVGIQTELFLFEKDISEETLCAKIDELNKDLKTNGILVQLPLPNHLNERRIINSISPKKDVDGLTESNLGKLFSGNDSGIAGCTASGVITLLKESNIVLAGKDVVVVNRSLLIGKPLVALFLNENATVTICHSKTRKLKEKTLRADIIVMGVGQENFLKKDMIKKGAVVVDVGINRSQKNKKIKGDVDFVNVAKKASSLSPVPGGVGPMTVAMLLRNTLNATIKQNDE